MIRLTLLLLSGVIALISTRLASAQTFFRSPPTAISIHNPSSTEGQRNRTTISVVVPEDAGASLESVVLSQLTNIDQWNWGSKDPEAYLGEYELRRRGIDGLATADISNDGEDLIIRFAPAIEPGQQVNVVFRSFNPDSDIYQWSTTFIPDGEDVIASDGPTLRVNIYRDSDFR